MKTLNDWRQDIDELDRELLEVIARRQEIVVAIQRYKANQQLPARDPEREAELLQARGQWAEEMGLDPQQAREVFKVLLAKLPHR